MSTTRSIQHAPDYSAHREAVAGADGLPATLTNKTVGMNCHGYLSSLVQIVPSGGSNPTVELLTWSDAAGHFIPQVPAAIFAAPGADLPFEITVECRSRIIFVRFTINAAGVADAYIAGHELDHTR